MRPIRLQPNEARTGFKTSSDYVKAQLTEWMKKYSLFEIKPIAEDTPNSRRYLEGAVIVDYCHWQYGIDPREGGKGEVRRQLFKQDFHYEIVKNRDGEPTRIPLSTRGEVRQVTDTYTRWAEENGAPIPNPELFKKYKNEYSMDMRWDCFHDWLDTLGLASDSMPSAEVYEQLN